MQFVWGCDPLFEPNGQILDPLEWIAKVTLHIPEGAEVMYWLPTDIQHQV